MAAIRKLPLMNGDGIRALIDFTMNATDEQLYRVWLRPAAPKVRKPKRRVKRGIVCGKR